MSVYAKSGMVIELVSRKLCSGKESQGKYGEYPNRLPYPVGMWLFAVLADLRRYCVSRKDLTYLPRMPPARQVESP